MGVKLFKRLVVINKGTNDEKKFYEFYLRLSNGSILKIKPNSFKDNNGNTISNYRELCLIAEEELF